jgi:DNA invertase Pin-like site-specific DNA recombinase
MIYGYCRVSCQSQNLDRQKRNILNVYPGAKIYAEAYTGTKLEGRKELDKLIKVVKSGDTIVFDSASRMSRNAEEAVELYTKLFEEGVILEFLKEPQINTEVFKKTRDNRIKLNCEGLDPSTNKLVTSIIEALNEYTIDLARAQIRLCFEQAEKEVSDLRQRTKEGIETARINGKQIGRKIGERPTTKKSIEAKKIILKYSRDFEGDLNDKEVCKIAGISFNTFYKYKKELKKSVTNKDL